MADLLDEPGREQGGPAAESEACDHQPDRDESALCRYRIAVAVSDGRDRRARPPQRVAEVGMLLP
jgi:hypothetical protein